MAYSIKKTIKGNDYYYIVQSTRTEKNKWKKIQRYFGRSKPTKKDLENADKEFNTVKLFLDKNKEQLKQIKQNYKNTITKATKDQLLKLEQEFIAKFTYNTNRIEGNSLSYKDTLMLLNENLSPKDKPLRDIKETENHKKAYLHLKDNLKKGVTKDLILNLHKILKTGVSEDAGTFRNGNVYVGNLIPVNHKQVPIEITRLLSWYKKNKTILHPLELATIFHADFERIHPFFDGNGRVGRLLLNLILLKNNYPPTIIQNKNRRRYYNALRKADNGDYLPLIKYLFSELIQTKTI